MNGIPKDWRWRVVQRKAGKQWRTWLCAYSNMGPNLNPLYPRTAEQEARSIFATVTGEWPEKEWAIIDPDHNIIEHHRPA